MAQAYKDWACLIVHICRRIYMIIQDLGTIADRVFWWIYTAIAGRATPLPRMKRGNKAWHVTVAVDGTLDGCSTQAPPQPHIAELLTSVLNNQHELTEDEIVSLFDARGQDFSAICSAAGKGTFLIASFHYRCNVIWRTLLHAPTCVTLLAIDSQRVLYVMFTIEAWNNNQYCAVLAIVELEDCR